MHGVGQDDSAWRTCRESRACLVIGECDTREIAPSAWMAVSVVWVCSTTLAPVILTGRGATAAAARAMIDERIGGIAENQLLRIPEGEFCA